MIMKYKASLHLHTKEDSEDGSIIKYSIYDLIDEAARLNFKILALTGHKTFLFKSEYGKYAQEKGILLIPGIEAEIKSRHCLILNCDQSTEKIKSIDDLIAYKRSHPECFVIAPHPNYKSKSLGLGLLEKNPEVFDAIEHSWFYSRKANPNIATANLAKKIKKPLIATADLHRLEYLDSNYAVVDCDNLDVSSVFEAIRQGRFENVSQPQSGLGMIIYFWSLMLASPLRSIKKFFS